jgi:hypothetical protein
MRRYDEKHRMLVAVPPHGEVLEITVKTHRASDCVPPCSLHSPSHHMADWPMVLRADKYMLVERICEHGVGHPDPDSFNFIKLQREGCDNLIEHTCDGCCRVDK